MENEFTILKAIIANLTDYSFSGVNKIIIEKELDVSPAMAEKIVEIYKEVSKSRNYDPI